MNPNVLTIEKCLNRLDRLISKLSIIMPPRITAEGSNPKYCALATSWLVTIKSNERSEYPRCSHSVNGGGNMYRRGGAKMYHGLGGSLSA